MKRALVFLLLLAAASQVCAEDDAVQRVYAAMEPRIRGEYEFHLAGVARQVLGSGAPASKIELFQKRLKLLAYNRAVLVAYCIADAERDRPPNARPIPMEQNLVLTACVDEKVGQLQKFSQLAAYVDFFFPERIESCGQQARSPEHEQVLRPYAFLSLEEPRLYDFALMLGVFYCASLDAPLLTEVARDGVSFARVYDIRGRTISDLFTAPPVKPD